MTVEKLVREGDFFVGVDERPLDFHFGRTSNASKKALHVAVCTSNQKSTQTKYFSYSFGVVKFFFTEPKLVSEIFL